MTFPYQPPAFNLAHVHIWIQQHRPLNISMTDKQYAYLSGLLKKCVREIDGVPITFVDAPGVV